MFKKTMAAFTAAVVLGGQVFAAGYNADCMNQKGKMTGCKVDVSGGTFSVRYKRKQMYSKLDRTVPGDKITGINMGNYARRRVAEAVAGSVLTVVAFPPLALLALTKKKRDQIGVEFTNEEGEGEAVLISVKKKYGVDLARNLRAVSGQKVVFEESPKKKVSKKELKRREAIHQNITPAEEQWVKADTVSQE